MCVYVWGGGGGGVTGSKLYGHVFVMAWDPNLHYRLTAPGTYVIGTVLTL